MSAFKKAENGDGYIIRYFNPFISKTVSIKNNIADKAVMLDEKSSTEKETDPLICHLTFSDTSTIIKSEKGVFV